MFTIHENGELYNSKVVLNTPKIFQSTNIEILLQGAPQRLLHKAYNATNLSTSLMAVEDFNFRRDSVVSVIGADINIS